MLVSEFLQNWIDLYSLRLKPHSISGYKVNINHANEFIGHIELEKITQLDIQNMYAALLRKYKRNTVLYVHRTIREAMQYAVEIGYIAKNPCVGIILPKKERYIHQIIAEEQAIKMLQFTKSADYDMYIVLLLALDLGLRRGEIIGLKYTDIDENRKTMCIGRSSEVKHGKIIDDTPKTNAGFRSLLLSDTLFDLLMMYKETSDGSRICRLTQDQITYRFKQILTSVRLPDMRFHDLRHTCATLLLKKGVPAKIVSERLGHSSITVTLDLYSHVLTTMQEPAAGALDDLII